MRAEPLRRALVLAAVAGLTAASGPTVPAASARAVYVRDASGFARAAARLRVSGGTIVLLRGRYEQLVVGPRGGRTLTIRGTRGASVGRVELLYTRSVRLVRLRLTPRFGDAGVEAVRSTGIRIERALVTGFRTYRTANVYLKRSRGVVISRSRFSRCGEPEPCVLTGRSSNLQIVGNRFHDCFGCDFIRGHFGTNVVIRSNRFDRSLVGRCGRDPRCNHQDLVEFHSGRGLLIERNRFGVWQVPGGGQIALFGPVDDAVIRNNVFLRTDPRVPGVVARVGINLGGLERLAKGVVITHNTILSGAPWRAWATSVRIKGSYAFLPRRLRPILANNVIRLVATPRVLCGVVRVSMTNVIERGVACSGTDVVGDAGLDAHGRPTARSSLTIDRASQPWRTRYDVRGFRRDARPDIGAYEYRAPGTGG